MKTKNPTLNPNFHIPNTVEVCLTLARLTRKLAARLEDKFFNLVPSTMIELALAEAETEAHETGYPHLILPLLAEEKINAIAALHHEQLAA